MHPINDLRLVGDLWLGENESKNLQRRVDIIVKACVSCWMAASSDICSVFTVSALPCQIRLRPQFLTAISH